MTVRYAVATLVVALATVSSVLGATEPSLAIKDVVVSYAVR